MPSHSNFVHLHAHTEYSLLDGACRVVDDRGKPSELIRFVASHKMPALAMTDHGNLFGTIEFYRACQEEGIKPILGMEAYVAPASRKDKSGSLSSSNNHLTLLAKNDQGYQNLLKLSSLSYMEGYYYKPRIDWESLEQYHEGIIALSGCLKGKIAETILRTGTDEAKSLAGKYHEIFGKGNFYLELMDHGIENQQKVDRALLEISRDTGIPMVATNDCHYLKKEDAFAHDILLCIGTGKLLTDTNRMKYAAEEFYYKTPEEMEKIFSEVPSAIQSTVDIANQCNIELRFDRILLPHYQVPQGETMDSYLEKLCLDGLRKRYGQITPTHKARLEEELSVIKRMGFSAYFLIVWDFVNFARSEDIPVGPGRGSGAGSLVSYILGITNIDPLRYGLLFERFLNPDRRSMPDLDIDFSDEGREKVIQYVRLKYGSKSVAQIITFGSMMARLVVRDVGRVLQIPLVECDRIAKLIPREIGITIASALHQVPELKSIYQSSAPVKQLLDVSQRLEGLKRHTGVHAAGIVIVPTQENQDITHFVPVAKGSNDVVTTQYNDESLLKLGVLKMDFLGLRTLTVLKNAENFVKERIDRQFNLDAVSLEDPKTFKLLADAKTTGIFQLESSGMRDLLRKLKPNNLEDVIALVSLYRPGPMGSGMLNDFVARKHTPSKVKYDHPSLQDILKETYGIIVYQEQVMKISRVISNFTAGQADVLRKAMGKKIPEEITKLKANFMEGSKIKGIAPKIADKIFTQIEHFGGYGFNKSHATAYGLLAYQTAYLKANYPHEYMASLISSAIGHANLGREEGNKLTEYIEEARGMGIDILAPDVQTSQTYFGLTGQGKDTKILFGLVAIKNVGENAVKDILSVRANGAFQSLEDFCRRVDSKTVNKKVMESLIKAGAFDFCGGSPHFLRSQQMHALEKTLQSSSKIREDQSKGQGSLFDHAELEQEATQQISTEQKPEEWHDHELLSNEKEVLGFYLSGHPLAKFKEELQFYSSHHLGHLPTNGENRVRIAGIIENVRRLVSKQQKTPYARFKLEDLEGEIDCVVFPKAYADGLSTRIHINHMVLVSGRLNRTVGDEEGRQELIVDEILPLEKARENYIKKIVIQISTAGLDDPILGALKTLVEKNPGRCGLDFVLHTPSHGSYILKSESEVKLSPPFLEGLKKMLGDGAWKPVI